MQRIDSVNHPGGHRRRGAILSMELVLVLPIFLVLVFAVVEFTMLMSARTRVGDVARNASRLVSTSGYTADEAESLVREMLGPVLSRGSRIQITNQSGAGSVGNVRIDVPMNQAAPDLLWLVGFGLSGRVLTVDAPMVMERDMASSGMARF